jgi:hypothetical protein
MTPVTLSGVLLSAALGCGLLTAVPAAAEPSTDPVSGLVGDVLAPPRDGARDRRQERDYGHTHAEDGVLRSGCHNYRFRYRLNVRTNDWTLETFLRDPSGETIASGAYTADADPKRGRAHFRFCRYNTQPGRFTIRAKLTFYNASGEHTAWLDRSHFRLRRA